MSYVDEFNKVCAQIGEYLASITGVEVINGPGRNHKDVMDIQLGRMPDLRGSATATVYANIPSQQHEIGDYHVSLINNVKFHVVIKANGDVVIKAGASEVPFNFDNFKKISRL